MAAMPAEVGCAVISVVLGVFMMFVFKYISPQHRIEVVKDRMMACVLGVWLYRDQPRMILRSQVGAGFYGISYLSLVIFPMLAISPLIVLVLAQMNAFYDHRPIAAGQTALVTLTYAAERPMDRMDAALTPPQGVHVAATARSPHLRQVSWKLVCDQPIAAPLTIRVDGQELTKQLAVGGDVLRAEPLRRRAGFWNQLLYPSEPGLDAASPVESIRVEYAPRDLWLIVRMHWLWYSFIVMTLGVLVLRGPMGVAI